MSSMPTTTASDPAVISASQSPPAGPQAAASMTWLTATCLVVAFVTMSCICGAIFWADRRRKAHKREGRVSLDEEAPSVYTEKRSSGIVRPISPASLSQWSRVSIAKQNAPGSPPSVESSRWSSEDTLISTLTSMVDVPNVSQPTPAYIVRDVPAPMSVPPEDSSSGGRWNFFRL